MTEWQSISTVPRDGTYVLVCDGMFMATLMHGASSDRIMAGPKLTICRQHWMQYLSGETR